MVCSNSEEFCEIYRGSCLFLLSLQDLLFTLPPLHLLLLWSVKSAGKRTRQVYINTYIKLFNVSTLQLCTCNHTTEVKGFKWKKHATHQSCHRLTAMFLSQSVFFTTFAWYRSRTPFNVQFILPMRSDPLHGPLLFSACRSLSLLFTARVHAHIYDKQIHSWLSRAVIWKVSSNFCTTSRYLPFTASMSSASVFSTEVQLTQRPWHPRSICWSNALQGPTRSVSADMWAWGRPQRQSLYCMSECPITQEHLWKILLLHNIK